MQKVEITLKEEEKMRAGAQQKKEYKDKKVGTTLFTIIISTYFCSLLLNHGL